MDLRNFPILAEDFPAFVDIKSRVTSGGVTQFDGLPAAAKALVIAQMSRDLNRPIVFVTYNAEQADRICADLALYGFAHDEISCLTSSLDALIFSEGAPDLAVLGQRTASLIALALNNARVVVGSIAAFLQATVSREELIKRKMEVRKGASYEVRDLETTLLALGYDRVESVEFPGQWTRRGGILDIFPANTLKPVRIDFFGDDVESIRRFDVESQRSVEELDSFELLATREVDLAKADTTSVLQYLANELPLRMDALKAINAESRGGEHAERLEERIASDISNLKARTNFDQLETYIPLLTGKSMCALDLLPENCVLMVDEPNQAEARWAQLLEDAAEIAEARAGRGEWLSGNLPFMLPFEALGQQAQSAAACVVFSLLGRGLDKVRPKKKLTTHAGPMETFSGRVSALFEAIDGWLGSRFRVVLVTEQPQRIREMLNEHRIVISPNERLLPGGEAGVYIVEGTLPSGYKLAEASLMVATDTDIFGHRVHQKAPKRAFKEGLKITSYLELREGDYVVHINHGIGHYAGITRLKGPDGAERDYLLLEYAGGDKVYVPTDQVDRVQKYIGSNDSHPTVTRLNSGEWSRATKKAKKQVQEMAEDLIKLYAQRKAATGHSAPPDTPWQAEMEDAFPFTETPDQLSAIEDVKRDLEDERPMDRLICGDVGYGKTEVSIRAAFKIVNAERQVAILCPTTILAQQHLYTFRERLAAYPVKIEMLSRFVSKSDTERTLRGLEDGSVDIVVGTHKLLSKDVKFRALGLLVIDEEQRFGVVHKERIKQMKKSVDVLSMSATPIPRTLHMALSGIRDMSLINDPPEGRLPIRTFVKEHDDELVREVILRELDRGGQIYYLHNRVESIYHVADHLRRMVGQAKVQVAHGQMHEDDLEEAMAQFAAGEFNVLVCTTIVESGLDIPNVNTIIVDNADKLGLSQLYQLRGRVGRSKRQGYAYLLFRKDKVLSEVAEKRLSALREFSDLGSGFKVALRDLEIRGAGNLLGAAQSGTVATVGFDLYTQLLSQAINELKGEDIEPEWELPNVALPLDAHIPSKYIPSEGERILVYKKLASVRSPEAVSRIQEELEDRYGDPPRTVWNLLSTLRLRLRCRDIGIGSVVNEKRRVAIRFQGLHLTPDLIKKLGRTYMQHQFLPDVVYLATSETPAKMLHTVEEMIEVFAKALPKKELESTSFAPNSLRRDAARV